MGHAAASECFTQEENPVTTKIYTSAEEYNSAVQEWKFREPRNPGIISLARAYAVYSSEKDAAAKISHDKLAHCYMGCRISQEVNFRTAEYVGWLKEDKDIKDCNKNTHFDESDFDATVDGAQRGQSAVDAEACMTSCKLKY